MEVPGLNSESIRRRWITEYGPVPATQLPLADLVDDATLGSCRRLTAAATTHAPLPEGQIGEFFTMDQFHCSFKPLLKSWSAPSGFCGAMAVAGVELLFETLVTGPLGVAGTPQAPDFMSDLASTPLCSLDLMPPRAESIMKQIHSRRTSYIQDHAASFDAKGARQKYLSAWYANYELSDVLREYCAQQPAMGVPDDLLDQILFLRENQWPAYADAEHEERERLVEEECFGGCKVTTESGSEGLRFDPKNGDRSVIVEIPNRGLLLRADEWEVRCAGTAGFPRIACLDVGGHFTCAVFFEAPAGEGGLMPSTLHFNTTKSKYCNRHMLQLAHFLFAMRAPVAPSAGQGLSEESAPSSLTREAFVIYDSD
ncbi:unnamed protein product [Symbiodinium necroappetens]|uniref:Uncharacterized protein n=1 Tax=Symbiodinium necroappetens TaxID=1628268 RepID=A0A812X6C7_9DINO|nr:unnamed protein product [Symbiodinium necroappetens]